MTRLPLFLLLTATAGTACVQNFDPNAASGKMEGAGGIAGTPMPMSTGGTGGSVLPPPTAMPNQTCETVIASALKVLKGHCSGCHQYPFNQANFSFVLDVDKLVMSTSSTGKKFVVPGHPDDSRIYERVKNNEMPPAVVTVRPTRDDLGTLWQWISSCAQMQVGRGGFGPLDAGAPDVLMEPPPEPCSSNNTCANGGCCVSGYCRLNGQSCTAASGGDSIPGTCTNGSCLAAGMPPCGNLNQACCGVIKICTAPSTVCPTGAATCQSCGKLGGRCCQVGGQANCDPGLGCVVMGTGDPGMCKPCGGLGQDCCGLGFRRTCNNNLTCVGQGGAKFTCVSGNQQPPPPDAGVRPPDGGGGGGQQRDGGRG